MSTSTWPKKGDLLYTEEEVEKLKAEIEAMKKDAERYRHCIDKGYLHPDYDPSGEEWDASMEGE